MYIQMKNSRSLKRNEMTKKLQVRGVDQTPYPSVLHGASLATAMISHAATLSPPAASNKLKLRRRSNSDYSPLVQGMPMHTHSRRSNTTLGEKGC